jgi:hypothetical protein
LGFIIVNSPHHKPQELLPVQKAQAVEFLTKTSQDPPETVGIHASFFGLD